MSEEQVAGGVAGSAGAVQGSSQDPWSVDTGFGWSGKIVTITGSKIVSKALQYGDGKAVINNKTGEQSVLNCWEIRGIADGEDRERTEELNLFNLIPTPDGEGWTRGDGQQTKLSANFQREAVLFYAGLSKSGFDTKKLVRDGKPFVSGLVGARLEMRPEASVDKNNQPKKNKKGYTVEYHVPVKFHGFKAGIAPVSAEDVAEAAKAAIVKVLEASPDKTITKGALVPKLSVVLAGNPSANAIMQWSLSESNLASGPWTKDGATLKLAA